MKKLLIGLGIILFLIIVFGPEGEEKIYNGTYKGGFGGSSTIEIKDNYLLWNGCECEILKVEDEKNIWRIGDCKSTYKNCLSEYYQGYYINKFWNQHFNVTCLRFAKTISASKSAMKSEKSYCDM